MGHCKKNIPCFLHTNLAWMYTLLKECAFQELRGPDGSSNVSRLEFSVEPENVVSLWDRIQLLQFVTEIEAQV